MSAATAIRRTILLVLLAAAGAAAAAWWRERSGTPAPAEPPQWPPLREVRDDARPDATSPDRATSWVAPLDDGSCPVGHPIKAKESSKIFHEPDGRFYERTNADRCYADPEAARADGYRRSKS